MDTETIEKAHEDFAALAREEGFGGPDEGEWDAAHIVAHIIASYRMVTLAGAELLCGAAPRLDNRYTQSEDYLGAIISAAVDWDGLLRELDQSGGEMFQIVRVVDEALAATALPSMLVHAGETRVDGDFVFGDLIGDFHMVGHGEQLAQLRP
jgi:hypothetical protein